MIRFFLVFLLFIQPVLACDKLQETGYTMGKEGWIFRDKTDYQEEFKIQPDVLDAFQKFNQGLQKNGIDLIVALLPTRGMMHADKIVGGDYNAHIARKNYNELLRKLKAKNIPTVGLGSVSMSDGFYYKRDHHWSAHGAEAIAKIIADNVQTKNILQQNFITEKNESVAHVGSFDQKIEKYCGEETDPQMVTTYKTYLANQDIFAEQAVPEIVLVGTSNSDQKASKANFEGFLKQYIGADILNASISGGGVQSAMLQYLSSDLYKNHKPRLIIWEFPVYQAFNDIDFYKQAIPAIYRGCGDDAIMRDTLKIQDNKFSWDIARRVLPRVSYLSLLVKGFKGTKLRVTMMDDNQHRQHFNFERSKFYEADGQFFLDLSNYNNIKKIEAQLSQGDYEDVFIEICPYSNSNE